MPFVGKDGASIESDRGGSPIPALAYVQQIDEKLSVGAGVFAVSGMGVDYPTNLYAGNTLTSYMQARLTPGVAYKLTDKLSVGVTANVMMAQMKYDVASGFGQAKHDTATSYGIGATVGVKYAPVEKVSFGAAYETKSNFQNFEFDVPARQDPMGNPIPGGKDTLAFDQPQTATVGVSVTPVEMLLLAADVQWINWSQIAGKDQPVYDDASATGAIPWNMNWDDQWVMKVGAQVTPMKGLDLRAGYNYGKMPLDPSRAFENMAFPAVSEHHVTAGLGWQATQKLALNVTGVYALEAKIEGSNADVPPAMGGTGQGISSYSTEMSQYMVEMGLAYRF
jgi:long-chain fatty acid transport protein